MPKISVIVPVFRAEKYIRRCLDSILANTFADWECIVVDDGSPDASGAICDEYASVDRRFRVFHKKNGGVSSARNYALTKVGAKWVTFVDSDDFIHHATLSTCLEICETENLDFLQFSFTRDLDNFGGYDGHKSAVLDRDAFYKYDDFGGYVWSSFFKTCIIRAHSIKFDEKMRLCEDQSFLYEYMEYSFRLKKIDNIFYFYRDNPQSAFNNRRTEDMLYTCNKCILYKNRLHGCANRLDELVILLMRDLILREELKGLPDILARLKPGIHYGQSWRRNAIVVLSKISPKLTVYFAARLLPIYIRFVNRNEIYR